MPYSKQGLLVALVGSLLLCSEPVAAQAPGSLALALELRKLDGVKRVLMIGAHPDDEDTSLLTELARGYGAETAYLSLTRGEGGQNLIGPELGEGLGIVRTGELLAARRVDGGRQFFTRAFDFGFSKNAEEALSLWPEDELLGDVVWTVRTFRPHLIVSVFSGAPSDGHGQHQAAGIMANRVFDAAADPAAYPEHFSRGVQPWQATRLYRIAWWNPEDATTAVPTGVYDPLLGRSRFQVAMESRSQHRSQEMGAAQRLGPRQSNLELIRGVEAGAGFFAGADTSIVALAPPGPAGSAVRAALEGYRAAIAQVRERFDPFDPTRVFGPLTTAADLLDDALAHLPQDPASWNARETLIARRAQVARAAHSASGIVWDVRASDDLIVPGQVFRIDVEIWNGSTPAGPADLSSARLSVSLPPGTEVTTTDPPPTPGPFGSRGGQSEPTGPSPDATWTGELTVDLSELPPGQFVQRSFYVRTPLSTPPTRLYYLSRDRDGARYRWPDRPELWGQPRDPDLLQGTLELHVEALPAGGAHKSLSVTRPVRFRGVDPVTGEYSQPVQIVPALSVALDPGVLVWPEGSTAPREVRVTVRSSAEIPQSGSVRLELPAGFQAEPESHPFQLATAGAEATFAFELLSTGEPQPGVHSVRAVAEVGGTAYTERVDIIDYEHIPRTPLYRIAETRVSVFPVQVAEGLNLGYVMGSGDAAPDAIRQLGVEPTLLTEADLAAGDLNRFDVIVLGVRAYATREDLRRHNTRVLDFAREGGTLIVQYNQYNFPRGGFAPFPVEISRPHDRVSVEEAPVRVLEPDHPLASVPNRIADADFEGWIQERGLYFLGSWDDRYTPILEMNDPGEDPKRGSLVVAPLGRGVYVYTGLSFFRQLPAGVAGAYRLFANIISLKAPGVR